MKYDIYCASWGSNNHKNTKTNVFKSQSMISRRPVIFLFLEKKNKIKICNLRRQAKLAGARLTAQLNGFCMSTNKNIWEKEKTVTVFSDGDQSHVECTKSISRPPESENGNLRVPEMPALVAGRGDVALSSSLASFLVNGATTGSRSRAAVRANAFCLGHRSGMPTDLV